MEAERVPRMRTAPKIVAEIKAMDPNSDISEYYIRRLAKTGEIRALWAGTKVLIDLDAVLDYLRAGATPPSQDESKTEGVRRVRV